MVVLGHRISNGGVDQKELVMLTCSTDAIRKALGKTYHMSLVGNDAQLIVNVVNQGIDSQLQAVTNSQFRWMSNGIINRLVCEVSTDDMLIILRRLDEMDDDEAHSLRSSILYSVGIED